MLRWLKVLLAGRFLNALRNLDLLEADVTETPPEGALAPDSYEFAPGATVSSILNRMTAAQTQILAEAWAGRADGVPLASPEEALILASIVEKETGLAGERRQVASVFVKPSEPRHEVTDRSDCYFMASPRVKAIFGSWPAPQ